jgi:hypothetical protein
LGIWRLKAVHHHVATLANARQRRERGLAVEAVAPDFPSQKREYHSLFSIDLGFEIVGFN